MRRAGSEKTRTSPENNERLGFAIVEAGCLDRLDDQRSLEVDRGTDAVMFGSGCRVLAETVEPQAILRGVIGIQQRRSELRPLYFTDVTLENAQLDSLTVIFTQSSDFSKTSATFRGDCGDVVADKDNHKRSRGF
jgi:hypothetical protein